MSTIYDLSCINAAGEEESMEQYRGKVLLVVNTASKCGFTPQYDGLQKLYTNHRMQGFEILAFPCNQFGRQEPGTDEDIQSFCSLNYSVKFPVFAKIEVNGPDTHPLFKVLKKEAKGLLGSEAIKWNFTKFLIDRKGRVVERFAPTTTPEQLEERIEQLL